MELDPRVESDLLKWHQQLTAAGGLLTKSQLDGYYGIFRKRFGPSVLRDFDGKPLLDLMHNHLERMRLPWRSTWAKIRR